MTKAFVCTSSPGFDPETAIGAALDALQNLDVKKLDLETSTAISETLTALANDPKRAGWLYAALTRSSGTATTFPTGTGATLPGECVSVRRLCAATNWSNDRIYDLLNAGEIEGFRVGGRRFITTASVRAFIARRVADPSVIRYPNPLAGTARASKDIASSTQELPQEERPRARRRAEAGDGPAPPLP